MNKSKRLLELMMTVNRKRKFTVKELAREFDVSSRTILRDLQELSELGVPLYSEVGPHGGYQVLKERVLPPIAFTEEEAVALFFASHALRHYSSLPFEAEAASALGKFYNFMSGGVRDVIDQMKNRVDFIIPVRNSVAPYLALLLDAAIHQQVISIEYGTLGTSTCREIQPIGIYASNGLWYCPAYCFLRQGIRVFRCDRIQHASIEAASSEPLDLRYVHLGNREEYGMMKSKETVCIYAELKGNAIQRCEAELWPEPKLHIRGDGTGWVEGEVNRGDLAYFAQFFIGLGMDASVSGSPELLGEMRRLLAELRDKYAEA
ncbi:helix-turn-helix transcriptional regulator [Paenibacillus sp. sgz500958]|uniref:helix-turn-helix transcriptional regulator n=1 Tax=Paenibacillus sp. sgz500958 TaxID=3242475 RepID=UPI0036D217C9